ncbi:MAG: galactokinase [Burkholderiales bacterium]|nr:galactokinase [Phycisphaerae bacterium]
MNTQQLKDDFAKQFGAGGRVHIIRAPGRVNLIGEHTDYNDGFVFPMAIEPQVFFVCRARTDGKVVAKSSLFPGAAVEMSLTGTITKGEPKWGNYVRGPVALLLEKGVPLVGMDVLIVNTLPMGGGLSSSAAMEVGTTRSMLALAGQEMDLSSLALLCQKAEHKYADVPCGIMDQTIVAGGKAGHAMLLDCRDNSKQFIPLNPNDLSVVIVNSMVKHELSGGEYAERRSQCEEGVRHFQKSNPSVKALRDIQIAQIEQAKSALSDVVYRRCRHVVTENTRCLRYAEDLKTQRYESAGKLMVQSHDSMRDDYEITVPELDYLVETAMNIKGVYGSRMTGGGFGGCTVSLVLPRSVDNFMAEIKKSYRGKYKIDPVAFATNATDGASVVE